MRERPLIKISPDDILVERVEELSKATVDELLSKINPNALSVMNYTQETDWLKDDLYRNYLDNFPSPLPENSLAEDNPSLCNEWHPTKNMPLVPQNFTPNSGQKVWWLCEIGHEWEATIDSRNSNQRPSSCPYCSPTRKIASEENNLAKLGQTLLCTFIQPKMAMKRLKNWLRELANCFGGGVKTAMSGSSEAMLC